MAEKSFSVKEIQVQGSGTPTIESPGGGNLNITASTSTFSGNGDINGNLDVGGNAVITGSELSVGNIKIKEFSNNPILHTNTSDGSDNLYLALNAGGATSSSRGGGIFFIGNEYGSNLGGTVQIYAGNVSEGDILLQTQGSTRVKINYDGSVEFTHNINANGNIVGDSSTNITGIAGVTASTLTGTLQTAAQTNITSVGTLSALTVSGDINANGNIVGDSSTNITGIDGVTASTLTGTLQTAAQTNITSVGTLSALTVSNNITGLNLIQFNRTISKIHLDTTDGTDNKSLWLSGGGDLQTARGALAVLYGNEYGDGSLKLYAGTGGGDMLFHTGTTTTERLRIDSDGLIITGNSGTKFGSMKIQSFVAHGANASSSAFSAVDTTSVAAGVGGEIAFHGKYNIGAQDWAYFGHIKGIKENATAGNTACALTFFTRPNATAPQERLRITSGGNLKLPDNAKIELGGAQTGAGDAEIYYDNNVYLKAGSRGFNIHSYNGHFSIFTGANDDLKFGFSVVGIVIDDNVLPYVNDAYDLGMNGLRWDDVYATNGTIQTSDRNNKENILESDLGLDFINKLSPKSFKFKGKTRTHYGLIAQDIETVITDLGKTTTEFAPLIKGTLEDGTEQYGLRYTELISPIVKAIKELKAENDSLKARIAALESS